MSAPDQSAPSDPAQPKGASLRTAILGLGAVALIGGIAFELSRRVDFARPSAPAAGSDMRALLESPAGLRRFRLRDGSRVALDTNTQLDVELGASERRVQLINGRARFEIARDDKRPLRVGLGQADAVAASGVFDASMRYGKVEVMVLEGSVDVALPGAGSAAPRKRTARAGETVQIGADALTAGATAPGAPDWISGRMLFGGVPLARVVAEANRRSPGKRLIADKSIAKLPVNGALRVADPAALAEELASIFNLKMETRADGAIELRRRR